MHNHALAELALFRRLPCNGTLRPIEGERGSVAACDKVTEAGCMMRDHRACPRRLQDLMLGSRPSAADRAAVMRRAWVPDDIAKVVAENLRATLAVGAARAFMQSPLRLFVLAGGPRTGKTTAAAAVMEESGKSYCFCNPEALRRNRPSDDYRQRLLAVSVLTIDDLGTEESDDHGRFLSSLETLLVARFDCGLKTIITTNHSEKVFLARYRERIAARLGTRGRFVDLGKGTKEG